MFCLALCSIDLTEKPARITSNLVDPFIVPPEYHKFTDIFSKAKAESTTFHCSYDLQIKLENREKPSIRTIYSPLVTEQEVLKKSLFTKT